MTSSRKTPNIVIQRKEINDLEHLRRLIIRFTYEFIFSDNVFLNFTFKMLTKSKISSMLMRNIQLKIVIMFAYNGNKNK